jgi:hypothetical protein
MELTNFIKNNNISNYEVLKNTLENEPYNLKIKEDNDFPNLFLIHNSDKSNKDLDIVKECNGIILEKELFRIVCYSFNKCSDQLTLPDNLNKNNLFIENSIEGTLVRYFYYNGQWILCTKKCINSNKSRWISNKNFFILFEECLVNNNILDRLNQNYCYSFIITHPENNIVVNYKEPFLYHISTRDMISMNEVEVDIGVFKLTRTLIPEDNIENIIESVMNTKQLYYEGLIFIDTNYNRWKIRSPYFNRAREVWGNTNNRLFRFIELRKDINLLHEYLIYFPFDSNLFNTYEYRIKVLCSHILEIYVNKYILKNSNEKIPFYLAKIIYKLHGDFIKDKIKTDLNKIGLTLLNTDTKLLCFMLNHYEKSLIKQEEIKEDVIAVQMELE